MPKATIPRKPGSIMSYFEPVKLSKKLAKLEQFELSKKTGSGQIRKASTSAQQTINSTAIQTPSPGESAALRWILQGSLLKTKYHPRLDQLALPAKNKVAVAAFDLDSTLVDTKSPTPFPRNGSDWRWLFANTKTGIQKLAGVANPIENTKKAEEQQPKVIEVAVQGPTPYIVVIFSNQGGVVTKPDAKRYKYLKERIGQIAHDLQAPFWFYAATKESKLTETKSQDVSNKPVSFRKPAIGMWLHFVEELKEAGVEIDFEQSFFVGDAAGRPKDFSDSDLKFANTIGLRFHTPEEFF